MRQLLPGAVVLTGLVVAGALVFSPDPAGFTLPKAQRLLYVHVPLAWASYVAFGAVSAAGAWQLVRPGRRLGPLIAATAEAGTPVAFAAIATGIVWAREFAGYDPFRDPKLIATFVLLLALGALAVLARTARPEARDHLLAAFAVLGAFTVPASYLASRISVHPDFLAPGQGLESGAMTAWLAASTLAHVLLLAALAHTRLRIDHAEAHIARLEVAT